MNKKYTSAILLTSLLTALTSMTPNLAAARPYAQNCALGSTCGVPGDDGGQTVFIVTPASGVHYVCEVKSNSESLKFSVTSGKDFKITKGKGLYNANPKAAFEIDGRFKKPQQADDEGQIKITKLPFSSDGTVTCRPR